MEPIRVGPWVRMHNPSLSFEGLQTSNPEPYTTCSSCYGITIPLTFR